MRHPYLVLGVLYVVQGMPFGFQASALGLYLRSEGVSLTAVGLAGALALPWLLKALWAPLVDRYGSARFGRRRSWIVPMQILLATTCAVTAFFPPGDGRALEPLLVAVLLMNLFAATLDVAVDGLAIDLLRDDGGGVQRSLALGNTLQVVGFKAGMLIGGGFLLWASRWIGWVGHFGTMAIVVLAALALVLTVREPPPRPSQETPEKLSAIVGALAATVKRPGTWLVLLLVATYKTGESVIDPMFSMFLVDAGYERETLGLWLGGYGMGASVAGSVLGGVLATRMALPTALLAVGAIRSVPLVLELGLAVVGDPGPPAVIGVSLAEHFGGGMLTTVMFAFMMWRVDPRVGASHFTLLAAVEVLGKMPTSLASGWLAEKLGYVGTFGVGVSLSLFWLALVAATRRRV
ncbi:MAG: MFS transporter [Polyangiales bacterium]